MTKTPTSCDWIASRVIEDSLNDYVTMGVLPAKKVIHWRALGSECPTHTLEVQVVVFTDHLLSGFSPPSTKFFWDVPHFYNLHPQDIGPNSHY